ncbi:reductive dehalogenase [Desulfobacula phenolica]|uniref:Reductive dehalogenase n=1 Tax=Desulfobacula phenolica TaxID=90732 RepID=A0A1H2DN62_9BACT|nr:reductive dehalogenase [Desulfobacula phenolica]SDT84340.1 reductive dehalogenase [Desulfobacula phenolica]
MKSGWKWFEISSLLFLITLDALLFVLSTILFSEKMGRGLIISLSAFIFMSGVTFFFVKLKSKGCFESKKAKKQIIAALCAAGLFTLALFVPTEQSSRSDVLGSTDIKGEQQRYDAREQPGAELYTDMNDAVPTDQLTLSIYDICVGKVSYKVHRDGTPASPRIEVTNPQVLTDHIKDQAKALGARVVGVTELDSTYVFTNDHAGNPIRLSHPNAIVVGKDLKYTLASPTAPLPWEEMYSSIPEELAAALSGRVVKSAEKISDKDLEELKQAMRFFSEGGKTAVELARFIRGMGYSARAHYTRWSEVQIIPLAIKAGLGELARNGMIINKEMGPRGSFAVVTTDLPLVFDRPIRLGIKEFCNTCKKCADYCPVKAIPFGSPNWVRGALKWSVDGKRCGDYLVSNPKCLACIGSCPYNKPDNILHDAANFMVSKRSRLTNWLMVKIDDLLGYGQMAAPDPKFLEQLNQG